MDASKVVPWTTDGVQTFLSLLAARAVSMSVHFATIILLHRLSCWLVGRVLFFFWGWGGGGGDKVRHCPWIMVG